MKQQPFASPGEALEHHGVKGMRWGVRKKEETSGRDSAAKETSSSERSAQKDVASAKAVARKNEEQKRFLMENFTTSNSTLSTGGRVKSGAEQRADAEKDHQHIGGLSPAQKKALIGGGVAVVGIAGFIAYKHYVGGGFAGHAPGDFDVSGLKEGPISKLGLGKLSRNHPAYKLDDGLMVDLSRGYANMVPVNGFANEAVRQRHAELIKTFEEFRDKYPSIRNLNVEVVPMSFVPGLEAQTSMGVPAAVQAIGKGEARIFYNDLIGAVGDTPESLAHIKEWQPGQLTKDFLGYHEMGHLLAVANGNLPPSFDTFKNVSSGEINAKEIAKTMRYARYQAGSHKQLMKKHGLSFEELSKLSKYGATQPAEALAELSGYFHTPEYRKKMDPVLAKKAEALFNDMGGVKKGAKKLPSLPKLPPLPKVPIAPKVIEPGSFEWEQIQRNLPPDQRTPVADLNKFIDGLSVAGGAGSGTSQFGGGR